jgi:hypothetical protein
MYRIDAVQLHLLQVSNCRSSGGGEDGDFAILLAGTLKIPGYAGSSGHVIVQDLQIMTSIHRLPNGWQRVAHGPCYGVPKEIVVILNARAPHLDCPALGSPPCEIMQSFLGVAEKRWRQWLGAMQSYTVAFLLR